MTFEQILAAQLAALEESKKILSLDDSHSALQQKLQAQVATDHRLANAANSLDYYDYPYVVDTYGDNESGTVVTRKQRAYTVANYKAKDGKYTISGHKPAKHAYVTESGDVLVDGETLAAKESGDLDLGTTELAEAFLDKDGKGLMRVIVPGQGSSGYYSKETLVQAANDRIFPKDMQMFFDHQTKEELAARPEGSVKNLGARFTGDAQWQENGPGGPGLYAPIQAFDHTKGIINDLAKSIGTSIRAFGTFHMGEVNGQKTKIVDRLLKGKSVDFVTVAGAGGALMPLVESYRKQHNLPDVFKEKERKAMELTDAQYAALVESQKLTGSLQLQMERLNETMARTTASGLGAIAFREAKLPLAAQNRLCKFIMSESFTVPMKDGKLDQAALTESFKTLAADEANYLKEAGIVKPVVAGMGGNEGTEVEESEADRKKAKEEAATLDESIRNLAGLPPLVTK